MLVSVAVTLSALSAFSGRTTHDLRRSLVMERTGEAVVVVVVDVGVGMGMGGTASRRPRSGRGSVEASLLLLANERKREALWVLERRGTAEGRMCTPLAVSGVSSDERLDAGEELSEGGAATGSRMSRSLTRGKYVYEAALGSWARSGSRGGGGRPTSEAARWRPRMALASE